MGCPGSWWSHRPWRYIETCTCGTKGQGLEDSIDSRCVVVLGYLRGLFQS